MTRSRPLDDEILRLWLVFAAMLLFLGFLGAWLWRIQVTRADEFRSRQVTQSIRRVPVPGTRGRMFDRAGLCVADNRPSFNVALYLEELRQPGAWSQTVSRVQALLADLSDVVRKPVGVGRGDIQVHIRKRLALPLVAWRDIDETALARLMEREAGRPGVDLSADPVRFYPFGQLACHVIGYVGRTSLVPAAGGEEAQDNYRAFDASEAEGKSGLEKVLDRQLRGVAGERLLRVDVAGYRRDDVHRREAQPGHDVQLALDVQVQKLVETALGGVPGAAVVLDPRNGDVLAMASSPGFNPNDFLPFISGAEWAELTGDADKPLLNRAISEHYAPGSTFKPVTMMAALDGNRIGAGTAFDCPGHFELGAARFRCWFHAGHGTLDAQQAIQFSCNVYMFHSALLSGPQPIHDLAAQLGLGQRTRVGLEGETPGINPDHAWKRKTFGDGWRDGDTCNLSIGQGFLSTTPLQMAMVTATIANGGAVYRPRLLLGTRAPGEREFTRQPPELVRTVGWSLDHLNLVRRGMRDVVMSERGTGRLARAPGVEMAGKTGTAQFESHGEMKRHAWMIAYAPFTEPRYAIAMVVDEGVSGGETIGPRIRQIVGGLFPPADSQDGASG